MRGDGRQAAAAGPAHGRRIGMNVAAAAIFPDAGVGRERELGRLCRQRFQQMKQAFIARPRQPPVEEHRRGGQNDAAEGVVLGLLARRRCRRAPARHCDSP